jgi:integrase
MSENKYKLVPVLDSRKKRIPGLYTRSDRYYLRAQVKGRQRLLASPHDTKLYSMRWAKKKRDELRHGIEEPAAAPAVAMADAPAKKPATIEALVDTYRKAAADRFATFGKPQPHTVAGNIRSLLIVVRQVNEVDEEQALKVRLGILDGNLVKAYVRKKVEQASSDYTLQKRARVTATSTLTQARSVFAKWTRPYYQADDLVLPDLEEFKTAGTKERMKKYELPPQALRDKTAAAALKLLEKRSPLYLVYELAYECGMRSGEIRSARWDWIEENRTPDGTVLHEMNIRTRPDWKGPKNLTAHRVPISAELLAELEDLRSDRPENPFILPGGTDNARHNLIRRTFAMWMRKHGWDSKTYVKAAHELRKLAGSRWYTMAGLEWAAKWLGDTPAVVAHYYADIDTVRVAVNMRG